MLASMRAELLVLRKWPAAWGLLLVTPLLILCSGYVANFIGYLTLTPAHYATWGPPRMILPSMLPSQFNIIAVNQFTFSGTAPFIILGAIMAGGDWGRGTIATALLQRPGRARTFAGQALALAVAVTASVLASFAVAAAASLAVLAAESKSATPYAAAMPPALVIAESAGAALLVALTYAMLGLFLGTVCRSGAAAIAAGLLWTLIVESTLNNLAPQYPQGILRTISDLTPGTAATVVTGLFGTPGGGASSSVYLATGTTHAIWTLAAYLAAALALTVLVLRRRDAVTEPSRRLRFRRRRPAAAAARPARPAAQRRPRPLPAADGVLASLRAELLIMSKRPAVWALVLIAPAEMLLNSYLTAYVLYATPNTGSTSVSASSVLSTMMPGQYLPAALNGAFGLDNDVYGAVVFMLLGALIGGSDWGQSTIKTALLQGPTRLRTYAGQALAVAIAVAASVALTFALAAAASAAVALHQAGSPDPAGSQFPAFGHLAAALAAALIMCLAYAAVGLTLGIWLRSATAGIAAVLLWAVVIQPSIERFAPLLHGAVLRLYEIIPDAATNTVINLAGNPNFALYGSTYSDAQIAPALAFLTFGLYAAAFLTIPALITRRRDIL